MSKNILVVEDDAKQAREMTTLLRKCGYKASYVLSSEEAICVCGAEKFDCLVVDYCMPQIDGVKFVRTLRQSGAHTPVVILTASDKVKVEAAVDDLEVWNVLEKPTGMKELGESIEEACEWFEMPPEVVNELEKQLEEETKHIGEMRRDLDDETKILPPFGRVL